MKLFIVKETHNAWGMNKLRICIRVSYDQELLMYETWWAKLSQGVDTSCYMLAIGKQITRAVSRLESLIDAVGECRKQTSVESAL